MTDRASSEQDIKKSLIESEARLRAVVETAVDAIITIDERGIIESFNTGAENLFGYTTKEIIGENISSLMPNPHQSQHDQYLKRYLETGIKRIIGIGREVHGLRKDGQLIPIDVAISEVQLGDRRIFTGICRDISEQRRLASEVLEISTQEKQRIGRDLHDGLGQELTGIAFLASVLEKQLASEDVSKAEAAKEIVDLVNQTIDHTRALVRGLCPVGLEEDGLQVSLQDLSETIVKLHGIECQFKTVGKPIRIDQREVAAHLHYIAHEAVNNAVKYSECDHIVIQLKRIDEEGVLSISDDGKGFPNDINDRPGRGRHIMQYRARMIGGTYKINSTPGHGTTIACRFPIPQKHD